MTGFRLRERMGKLAFGLMFVGFNMTFWPQFVLGLRGMPRRYLDYPGERGSTRPNLVSTIGAGVLTIGRPGVPGGRVVSVRRREPAGDDPWDAYTLEWATTSPPPEHNFDRLPRIRSERPAFDLHHPQRTPVPAKEAETR